MSARTVMSMPVADSADASVAAIAGSAEIAVAVTERTARESVAVARSHGEKFFEQIVWQVENEVWTLLGYDSWDAMREGEYGDLGVVAPRADRPELVARLRARGLTQQSIGDTLGVDQATVSRLNMQSHIEDEPPAPVTNSRGQQRPGSYMVKHKSTEETTETFDPATGEQIETFECVVCHATFGSDRWNEGDVCDECELNRAGIRPEKRSNRRPLMDAARDAGWNLRKAIEKVERIADDDRFARNKEEMATQLRSHLRYVIDSCQRIIDDLDQSRKD